MNAEITSPFKKIVFTLFIIFSFISPLYLLAQSNEVVLSETTMRTIMDSNKESGKPTFSGINSKFVIATNNTIVSSNDSAQIVTNISKLPEVISCVYHPSKQSLIVKSKKEDETSNFIIKIKGQIVPFKVYILKYEEIVYTEKK